MKTLTASVAVAALLVLAGCSDSSQPITLEDSPSTTALATTIPAEGTDGTATLGTTTTVAPGTTAAPVPLSDVKVDIEPVASGFTQPILATARPGDDRLFIADQVGVVYAVVAGSDPMEILDISDEVEFGGERGLLGLAFHATDPDRMFVHYTALGGRSIVAEYAIGPTGVADPFAVRQILSQAQPASNHNGGMIAFGPDGYLYIGLGDGGGANDQFDNGQDPHTPLGSILRVDIDAGNPYAIPSDNPFADGVDGSPEVWAWGLRNPWRFAFDGFDLWVGDVGQAAWEEIDLLDSRRPGDNGGWPLVEGTHCFRIDPCDVAGLLAPVIDYRHQAGRCSVTGGVVYRGNSITDLVGAYLYGDYCTGEVWALRLGDPLDQEMLTDPADVFLPALPGLTSFGTGPHGEVYLIQAAGTVWRLVDAG